MAIELKKNTGIDLSKIVESKEKIECISFGLSWDPIENESGLFQKLFGAKTEDDDVDLDASCIIYSGDTAVDVVYFGKLRNTDLTIIHTGDNRTGKGSGDDETIVVNVEKLPSNITKLRFTISSWSGQTFSRIKSAGCTVYDSNKTPLARFSIGGKVNKTGMIVCEYVRTATGWELKTIGDFKDGKTYRELA